MMTDLAIDVQNLGRAFSMAGARSGWGRLWMRPQPTTLWAVKDLSFQVEKGAKIAFIGPNGAGKSTTLRMLAGLLRPSVGTAQVAGLVPWDKTRELARQIGLVFGQRSALWQALAVRDSYDLLARIYDLPTDAYAKQMDFLTQTFGLGDFLDQPARTLSLGQRMRADIAAALLHRPQILFLDEPTIGLDVTAKSQLREHLNKLAQEMGTTILLTSHDTDDIEHIAERIILIDHGQKLIDTTLHELKRRYSRLKTLRIVTSDAAPPFEMAGVSVAEHKPREITLTIDSAIAALDQVVAACLRHYSIHDIGIENMPLEEVIKSIYLEQRLDGMGLDGAGAA